MEFGNSVVLAAAGDLVEFIRSLPHGDAWICLGVGIAAFTVLRFIVKRIILIIVVAAAIAAIAWWVVSGDPHASGAPPESGIHSPQEI